MSSDTPPQMENIKCTSESSDPENGTAKYDESNSKRPSTIALAHQVREEYVSLEAIWGDKALCVHPETVRLMAFSAMWFVLCISIMLTYLFVDPDTYSGDFINVTLGYAHLCTFFDYYPVNAVATMLWFPVTFLFCVYFTLQAVQTDVLADNTHVPSIGEKWRATRFYGMFAKGFGVWSFYMVFSIPPWESMYLHLGGYVIFAAALIYIEVEQAYYYICLENDREGGLPFQEYLGRWAKPVLKAYIVLLLVTMLVKLAVFWGMMMCGKGLYCFFPLYLYDPTNPTHVIGMKIIDRFGTVISGVVPMLLAYNLRSKSAPVVMKAWLNEKVVSRFSVRHPYGYPSSDWDIAIAKQRKAFATR